MELIGSIANQGTLQGQINDANGYLTGVITNAGLLGGQVVAERGLKGDKGETGDTGATGNGIASVTYVSSSGLVDTYKITFTNGTETTFDVTNGEDGTDGIDGVDGHSPVVTASKVGKVTTISVDGSAIATINDGNDGQDGSDGQDGADGYSPSASVSKSGNKATITITDKDGTTTADVYDGSSVPSGGTTGQVLTKDSDMDYDASWEDPSGGTITDVTVDGTSIVDDGVAELETVTQLRDGLMTATDKQKLDGIASGAEVNVNADWSAVSGDAQILNKPTIPSKTSDLTNDSGFITGMEILSYGNSTWQNFIDAYNANRVVYCRASSNSNPASGAQTRLAFMAYVNSSTPTEVEFQYYRSVSSHSASQQGDQVFVYKLNSAGTWSVTTREASSKIVAGTGLSSSYSSGVLTLTSSGEANVQSDWSQSDTTADDYIKNKPTIPTKVSELNNDSGFITGVTSTSTPTASTIAEFDASSCLNSTDMTSSEVEDFVDELDVSGGLLGDYVVEQGTSGIWTCRKWNSGMAECWSEQTVSVDFSQQISSNFRMTTTSTSTTYPDIFTSIDCALCSASHGTSSTWLTMASGRVVTSDHKIDCGFAGWNSGGSQSVILSINIKGTWK